MYVVPPSPVDTIRADFRRVTSGPVLHRLWHFLLVERERATDRATAHAVQTQTHAGVRADDAAACPKGAGLGHHEVQ